MAKANFSIPPFPADIDRNAFGHWLSGFADGESHFNLDVMPVGSHTKPTPCASFVIKLRADDLPILLEIQSFWGCGLCRTYTRPADPTRAGTKPSGIYRITRTADLFRAVIPHFEAYPLRAKKRADYLIWKQGVELLFEAGQRPRRRRNPHRGRATGTLPRWSDEERAHFQSLTNALRQQRVYAAPLIPTPPRPNASPARQPTLFDGTD